ncbi:MAG TPA: signal peptidase II [Gemmatimonadales bacterium]|nr:signal peptidase II [Gemmatimonadales bacterium]HZH40367.1 signal peptidase II [Gemmatimonadales bacterium]
MGNGADRRLFWFTTLGVVTADLITKVVAVATLVARPHPLIGDYAVLRLVYNEGAAFGISLGPASRWIFLGLALIALVVLGAMVRATKAGDTLRLTALALVCGGAAGNLLDRIRSAQGVVDFIEVGIGPHRFPTFNVADSAITIGAVALAISLWLEGRHVTHAAPVPPPPPDAAKEAGAATP